MANAKIQYIVSMGRVTSGFNFYGPFTSSFEAHDWIEKNGDGQFDLVVIQLMKP